jgi:hypothetical protein
MPKFFTHQGLGALCFVLLVFSLSTEALAQHAANQVLTQRDLSSFRSIAEDTLAIVNMGNLSAPGHGSRILKRPGTVPGLSSVLEVPSNGEK